MIFNTATESNPKYYSALLSSIQDRLVKRGIIDIDLDWAVGHTVFQIVRQRKKTNTDIPHNYIVRAINWSALAVTNKNIKRGLIKKTIINDEVVYEDVNTIVVLESATSKSEEIQAKRFQIEDFTKYSDSRLTDLEKEILGEVINDEKNRKIAKELSVEVKKIENSKQKIKKLLKEFLIKEDYINSL